MRLQTDSVALKEMFLGTWIRGCNKGPCPLFKMQTHNRRLKRHLMNGLMEIIYSGARGFLGSRSLLNDCRVLWLACHSEGSSIGVHGVRGPSPARRGAAIGVVGQSIRKQLCVRFPLLSGELILHCFCPPKEL